MCAYVAVDHMMPDISVMSTGVVVAEPFVASVAAAAAGVDGVASYSVGAAAEMPRCIGWITARSTLVRRGVDAMSGMVSCNLRFVHVNSSNTRARVRADMWICCMRRRNTRLAPQPIGDELALCALWHRVHGRWQI